MKIRTRLVIAVLSLLVSSLLVIGTITVTAARRGLTRLATQHLSFKAEEIRKYAWNQWDVLVTNG
ncbi:MAG: adenylate/guanylate cyclase domain-containing protein, partial [Spirochaetaceae bacterium]